MGMKAIQIKDVSGRLYTANIVRVNTFPGAETTYTVRVVMPDYSTRITLVRECQIVR